VLGTAFALGHHGEIQLTTGAGVISVQIACDGRYGEMEQPQPVIEPYEREPELLAALGVGRSLLPVETYRNGPVHTFVMLDSAAAVAGLDPDLGAVLRLGAIGVSCFAQSTATTAKTCMFAPGLGVSEDPATGSGAVSG